MKLSEVSLKTFSMTLADEISSAESFLDYLTKITFPESLFLFNSQGALPPRLFLERPVPGMPGISLSKLAGDPKLIYTFRLVNAELMLPVRNFTTELGFTPKYPITWSAYFAKRNSKGLLPTHFDTHDVYVFQLFGERLWKVGNEELRMVPGSLLQIPMGVEHQVLETYSDSLHITLGHHVPSVHTFLRNFMEENRDKAWMGSVLRDDSELSWKLEEFIKKNLQGQ